MLLSAHIAGLTIVCFGMSQPRSTSFSHWQMHTVTKACHLSTRLQYTLITRCFAPQGDIMRLVEALDKLSRQTRQPDYLILVDDGSPLDIPSIIRCAGHSKIRKNTCWPKVKAPRQRLARTPSGACRRKV